MIDSRLGWWINNVVVDTMNLIANPILCIYASSVWVVIPLIVFIYICIVLQRYYMNANREICRLSKTKCFLIEIISYSFSYFMLKKNKLQDPQ